MSVYIVAQSIDVLTTPVLGVFSTPEQAQDYLTFLHDTQPWFQGGEVYHEQVDDPSMLLALNLYHQRTGQEAHPDD